MTVMGRILGHFENYVLRALTKGQLISKVLFGVLNSSKNRKKKPKNNSTWATVFCVFVHWRHQKFLLKLTDLYSRSNEKLMRFYTFRAISSIEKILKEVQKNTIKRLFKGWEAVEKLLRYCWDITERLLQECCETAKKLLRSCWDTAETLLNDTSEVAAERLLRDCSVVQSICTHYSCFENMGQFVTLQKIRSKIWTWKKQVAKNRVIVIQKEKRPGCPFSFCFWITTTMFRTWFLSSRP